MATKQNLFASVRVLSAVMSVAAATAMSSASAQTAQPAPPAAQPQAPTAGGRPMQKMEHGHQMMPGTRQRMMEKEKGGTGQHPSMGSGAMGAPPCAPAGQSASGGATNCK